MEPDIPSPKKYVGCLFYIWDQVYFTNWCDNMKNIKFKHNYLSPFQRKMKDDIKKLKNDDKIYVAADKTSNFYKLTPEKHEKYKV